MNISNKKTWLLAVSTGPDSMALFGMLEEEGIPFACAFVNYHTRKESDLEEEYISSLCKEKNIVCHILNRPFTYDGNFEANARTYRYDFFVDLCKEYNYAGVLIAHQEDDVLETYVMQKKKGIVPEYYGLQEKMFYHNVLVVRPLLSYTKQELLDYCKAHQIHYFVDSTNLEDVHERNRIRHHVIEPMTKEGRKSILEEIRIQNKHLEEVRTRARNLLVNKYVRITDYRKEDEEVRLALLRQLLSFKNSPSKKHLQEIDEVILKKDNFLVPVDLQNLVSEDGIFFLKEKAENYSYQLDSLMEIETPYFCITKKGKGTQRLHVNKEDFPLTIRNFQDGDEIEMFYGHKNVARFFIDRKIPLYKRATWPIVLNKDNEVILVPGLGCSNSHYSLESLYCVVQY